MIDLKSTLVIDSPLKTYNQQENSDFKVMIKLELR